uniref:RING-type domain-containing protein n=1 Tax=Hemiselmis andersenii TaxID=464988 RepID=A0A6U2HPF4_HEMAN|mmetsp:Transcript_41659/g.97207  ORF Transcript_41659/g.97207 Transcript_41659/m.97207 type:complete len:295 (+) Transcript_41659:1214-2098(+)
MPKRKRSSPIAERALHLIGENLSIWFEAEPDTAGAYVLKEALMPHFESHDLARAASSQKTRRDSIKRALQTSGCVLNATGTGRGHCVFLPGARWVFPSSPPKELRDPKPLHPFSALSACITCAMCFNKPKEPPAVHRQCQRGHSLCDECFEKLPCPARARRRSSTTSQLFECPKEGCSAKVSDNTFRNLVLEQALNPNAVDRLAVQTTCPVCLDDFDGHTPIIQCKLGHCLCLTCFRALHQPWLKDRRKGKVRTALPCPECRCVLAAKTTATETFRNKAAEYLFCKKLIPNLEH